MVRPRPMDLSHFPSLSEDIRQFNARGQEGRDPVAALHAERRKRYGLFSTLLTHAEMEALRPYLFCYGEKLPTAASDAPVKVLNLVNGAWKAPAEGKFADLPSLADRRVPLASVPASTQADVEEVVAAADAYWKGLYWADEVATYRKHVVANFARLMDHFAEECLREIRWQIPKTRLEAQKDFFEAKRAADHLGGSMEAAARGEVVPPMLADHVYWRNAYLPAGVSAIITPMNFIWGIPGIHLAGAYLAGVPYIYKGHPFAAISNTTMIRFLLASGADPRQIHKLEGFGGGIAGLATDSRVAVVCLTGSSETAKRIAAGRGVNRLRFEGGGCNWAWVDDGYSDEELRKIAVRLSYSKLGFGSHKCTSLHGVAASESTLRKLETYMKEEWAQWKVEDPREVTGDKFVSPLMVHKAQTLLDIVAQAKKTPGVEVLVEGRRAEGAYGQHSEACSPAMIRIRKDSVVHVNWDGRGVIPVELAKHEFFMPVLVTMPLEGFDAFLNFSLFENPHDLAVSIWTRDDRKLQRARRTLGGMLKENDGTDSALEWEEFGNSGIGESGNMGVGDITATLSIYSRRQKGRHITF